MATKLATIRKFGLCVCHNTGVLSANLVRNEQGEKTGIQVKTCDQHREPGFANKSLDALKATGLPLDISKGKALEPQDE